MMKKLPPIEKIYEAYTAVVDGRVNMHDHFAEVTSSDKAKTYIVTFSDRIYSSNDNGSYWQGYAGYPIIAVLLLQGKLPYSFDVAKHFRHINWKELNSRYKNKYSDAVKEVYQKLLEKGVDTVPIKNEVNKVYDQLKKLDISLKKSSSKPNKNK